MLGNESVYWNGRDATRLTNGFVELTVLKDGGHLAEFRLLDKNGCYSQNVLWEAPWMTSRSAKSRLEERSQTGGFTGHGLCLDYFGAPSLEEAAAGLPIHGEAATGRWNVCESVNRESVASKWNVLLPVARLRFERQIFLRNCESVAYVEETVHNERDADYAFHWVQHATFAPPFLNSAESTLAVSATRGITSPTDYENGSLLATNREFSWPYAPRQDIDGATTDLRQPFTTTGRGFLAAVQLDPRREVEFLLAMNWKLRLGVGYCFCRSNFPWMAIWEENCTRPDAPWSGKVQARGMEFGTTPLPLGREETFRRGEIFGTPSWSTIPAHGKKIARYLIFLFAIPTGMHSVQNVEAHGNSITLYDDAAKSFSIPAYGCEDFLQSSET